MRLNEADLIESAAIDAFAWFDGVAQGAGGRIELVGSSKSPWRVSTGVWRTTRSRS